jgi:hypothetical protein
MQADGSRSVVLPIINASACRRWVVSVKSHLLYPQEKDPVPIVQEATWVSGPVWVGPAKLAPTGVQTMDCPACSKLLYQLHYPRCPYIIQLHSIKLRTVSTAVQQHTSCILIEDIPLCFNSKS